MSRLFSRGILHFYLLSLYKRLICLSWYYMLTIGWTDILIRIILIFITSSCDSIAFFSSGSYQYTAYLIYAIIEESTIHVLSYRKTKVIPAFLSSCYFLNKALYFFFLSCKYQTQENFHIKVTILILMLLSPCILFTKKRYLYSKEKHWLCWTVVEVS